MAPIQHTSADTNHIRRLAVFGLAASVALYLLFYRARGDWDYNFGFGYGRDFVNFWAAGRLAALGDVAILFDTQRYNQWLSAALSDPITGGMVYSYPPTLIALLMPFGVMPYPLALAVWTAVSAGALALTLRLVVPAMATVPLLVLTAPALAVAAFQGHPTAVFAALFFGALMQAKEKPILAGALLGLLTVKPQLGVIAGMLMVIDRRWQTVAAAGVTAALLGALSLLIVGVEGWTAYLTKTVPMHRDFLVEFTGGFTYFLTTPYAGLRALGASHGAAIAMHGVLAIVLAAVAVAAWRFNIDRLEALLIAALASVLVTPYANIYDLALTAPFLALLAAREQTAQLHHGVVWLAPAVALPLAMVTGPIIGLVLASVVVLSGWRMLKPRLTSAARPADTRQPSPAG